MRAASQNVAPVQDNFGFCLGMLFCVTACMGYLKQQHSLNVWFAVGGQVAAAFLNTLPGHTLTCTNSCLFLYLYK